MSSAGGARAGIVVTGTEVLTGRVADRNGPWLAEQLRVEGVDIAHVVVVGDRPEDLTRSLEFLATSGMDLVITSGGLGPTADDLTAEVVAQAQGRPTRLDPDLEARVAAIVEELSRGRGWRTDPEATAAGVRKQAMVPGGATVLEPVGTAPGLVVPAADGRSGPPVVVLPGPPSELQPMWPDAFATPVVQKALRGAVEVRQSTVRMWGVPESQLSATMRALDLADLEVTTCLRDGELEIVTRYGPSAQERYDAFVAGLLSEHADRVFSVDGRTIDDLVVDGLTGRGWTIATAESCTAGLLAGRLTERAGSSAYVLGGLVVYSNEAKHDLAGVDSALIERVGAVSAEVAEALARGARERLRTDVGVGITGVAGPGGGTDEKPVGTVHLCVSTDSASVARRVHVPGDRAAVRKRSTTIALHLVRELLAR